MITGMPHDSNMKAADFNMYRYSNGLIIKVFIK